MFDLEMFGTCCCVDDLPGSQKDGSDSGRLANLSSHALSEEVVAGIVAQFSPTAAPPNSSRQPRFGGLRNSIDGTVSEPMHGSEKADFKVVLKKSPENQCLGLDVDITNGTCLIVKRIDSGAMKAWNDVNGKDVQVRPGDLILSINGVGGEALSMTQVCKNEDTLEILVKRGPGEYQSPDGHQFRY